MNTILDEIIDYKKLEVKNRRKSRPIVELERTINRLPEPRGFTKALAACAKSGPAVIAEFKRGSPSLGCIRNDLVADKQSKEYEAGGAAALSVLTDTLFFFAADDDFGNVRETVKLPMLRKDFVVDEYQIVESRAMGADCVLLIMSVLGNREAGAFRELARELGMDVLAEAHTADEIKRILDHVDSDLIGINNRNLKSFETSIETVAELARYVPDRSQLVAESGLDSPESIRYLWDYDIRRFLVGEAFIRSSSPGDTVHEFVSCPVSID